MRWALRRSLLQTSAPGSVSSEVRWGCSRRYPVRPWKCQRIEFLRHPWATCPAIWLSSWWERVFLYLSEAFTFQLINGSLFPHLAPRWRSWLHLLKFCSGELLATLSFPSPCHCQACFLSQCRTLHKFLWDFIKVLLTHKGSPPVF